MATENISIDLDTDIKQQAQELFETFGMSIETAIKLFLNKSIKEKDIPFEVDDPFYSKENTEHLLKVIRAVDSGKAKLTCHDIVEVD